MFKQCFCDCHSNTPVCGDVDFYQKWSQSRDSLKQVIADYKGRLSPCALPNIIIFGAGACRDLPMDYICSTFEEVVLVDISEESLRESLAFIPGEFNDRVCRVVWDINGAWGQMFRQFIAQIHAGVFSGVFEALNFLAVKGQSAGPCDLPEPILTRMPFPLVISDLVLTQLVHTAQGELEDALKLLDGSIRLSKLPLDLSILANQLIMQHLHLLYQVAGEDSIVLALCDTFMLGYATDGSESLFNEVLEKEGERLLSRRISRRDISRWFQRYTVLGSDVPRTLSLNSYKKLRVIDRVWWWWPLCDSRRFLVICYVIQPGFKSGFWDRLKNRVRK